MKRLAVGLSLVLLLSGCSAGVVAPTPSVGLTDVIPADPIGSFKKIAADSCDKAFASGLIETRDEYGLLVMVPKDQAYDGYSAAYKDLDTGHVDLIYEADSFYACAAALMWAMAAESGEGEIEGVSVAYEAGQYVLSEAFEDSTFVFRYTVVDGVIVSGSVTSTEDQQPTTFTEVYGEIGDANRAIIQQAVDELNASE